MVTTGRSTIGTRWSADTEIAFLLALKLTGSISAACREIGRSPQGANDRRLRDPAFAAKWQAVLDEQHWRKAAADKATRQALDPDGLAGGPDDDAGEMPNRVRHDGWTPVRQRAFLRALGRTGKIERACKLAGISRESARKMRNAYPSFAAAWDRALAKAEPTLEQIAVDRAVNGVSEPVYHGGEVVGHRTRYSDSLMRDALRRESERLGLNKTKGDLVAAAHAAARAAGGSFCTPTDSAKTDAALRKHLDVLAARLKREAAAAGEAAASGDARGEG